MERSQTPKPVGAVRWLAYALVALLAVVGACTALVAADHLARIELPEAVERIVAILAGTVLALLGTGLALTFRRAGAPLALTIGGSFTLAGMGLIWVTMLLSVLGIGGGGVHGTGPGLRPVLDASLAFLGLGIAVVEPYYALATRDAGWTVRLTLLVGALAGFGLALWSIARLIGGFQL
jgi:hypothetical protein